MCRWRGDGRSFPHARRSVVAPDASVTTAARTAVYAIFMRCLCSHVWRGQCDAYAMFMRRPLLLRSEELPPSRQYTTPREISRSPCVSWQHKNSDTIPTQADSSRTVRETAVGSTKPSLKGPQILTANYSPTFAYTAKKIAYSYNI
jgi:hypothetical protein